jgi:hypothetical protein
LLKNFKNDRTCTAMPRPFLLPSLLAAVCLPLLSAATAAQRPNPNLFGDDKVRLVVRADDFGFSHAGNMALRRLLDEGTITAAGA